MAFLHSYCFSLSHHSLLSLPLTRNDVPVFPSLTTHYSVSELALLLSLSLSHTHTQTKLTRGSPVALGALLSRVALRAHRPGRALGALRTRNHHLKKEKSGTKNGQVLVGPLGSDCIHSLDRSGSHGQNITWMQMRVRMEGMRVSAYVCL